MLILNNIYVSGTTEVLIVKINLTFIFILDNIIYNSRQIV